MCTEIRRRYCKVLKVRVVIHFGSKSVMPIPHGWPNDLNTIRDLGLETLELMISQD